MPPVQMLAVAISSTSAVGCAHLHHSRSTSSEHEFFHVMQFTAAASQNTSASGRVVAGVTAGKLQKFYAEHSTPTAKSGRSSPSSAAALTADTIQTQRCKTVSCRCPSSLTQDLLQLHRMVGAHQKFAAALLPCRGLMLCGTLQSTALMLHRSLYTACQQLQHLLQHHKQLTLYHQTAPIQPSRKHQQAQARTRWGRMTSLSCHVHSCLPATLP